MLVRFRDCTSVRAVDVTSIEINPIEFPGFVAVIVNLVLGSIGSKVFIFDDLNSAQQYASELYESVNSALREAAACREVSSPTMPKLASIMDDSAR